MFRKKVTKEEFEDALCMIKAHMDQFEKALLDVRNQHNEEYKSIYQYVGRFNDILGHLIENDKREQ